MAAKTCLVFCVIAFWPMGIQAQSWDSIRDNDEYISAVGTGATTMEADRNALTLLISQISAHVSSDTKFGFREDNNNQNIDHKSYVETQMRTYSQASLSNVKHIIIKNEPDAVVGRYIKKTELSLIFEYRKRKALDMVSSALKAEEMGKADDALRNYYWALSLVQSLQYPDEAIYTDENGEAHLLTTWIPERMNLVFDNIKISVVRRVGDDVDLSIAYKGKPVSSVDYTYFDGRDWSAINSAKDGVGALELARGDQNATHQLKIEYQYLGESHIDKEVEAVLKVANSRPMRKSYFSIDTDRQEGENYDSRESFSRTDTSIKKAPTTMAHASAYEQVVSGVVDAIRSRSTEKVRQQFTPEGFQMFQKLLFSYGTPRVVGTPQLTCYPTEDGGATARGLKVSFAFQKGVRKSFVEDLVLTFNNHQQISSVAFGLGKTAEDDILYKGVWKESTRKVLMNFLENYKTAYALKRLDYISTIFDDDAVIIVANVATRAHTGDGKVLQDNKIIRYNRYSKDQYLKNLKRCFDSNEFINIRFSDNDVRLLGRGGETYGIQIAQDYYSTSYGDKGYLYLEVDVNNPKRPTIKVRTWQPEKDPDFGLYGPGDFN